MKLLTLPCQTYNPPRKQPKKITMKNDWDKTAQEQNDEDDYLFNDDSDEELFDSNCPCCGEEYDEIDYEYQICHMCKYNNNKP